MNRRSAAQFRVAVDEKGAVRYCFLENSSGDVALDEQARKYLALSLASPAIRTIRKDPKSEMASSGGRRPIEWGNDIVAPLAGD